MPWLRRGRREERGASRADGPAAASQEDTATSLPRVEDPLSYLLAAAAECRSDTLLVSGPIGSGKTKAASALVEDLRRCGVSVGGILAPRVMEDSHTTGYDLLDVASGRRVRFLRSQPPGSEVGRFFLDPAAVSFGRRAILTDLHPGAVSFVDEVGRLELNGGGHEAAVRRALDAGGVVVLAVRTPLVAEVVRHFALAHVAEYRVAGAQLDD